MREENKNLTVFLHEIVLTEEFRRLFNRQRYEEYVYIILNRSQKILKDRDFRRITDQSNNQCDFVDAQGNKYELKTLFNKSQGALIGDRKNDITKWIDVMLEEKTEFSKCILNRDLSRITSMELYKITKERLLSVEGNENAIFFIPFPVVDDSPYARFTQLALDYLQAIYNQLDTEGLVRDRDVYYIYPSIETGVYVLRNAKNYAREYIEVEELKDTIVFNTTMHK